MDDKNPQPPVLEYRATVEGQDSLAAVRADIDQMRAQLIEQEHRTPYVALNAYRYFGKKSAKGDAAMKALFWRVFAPYTAAMVFAGGGGIIAGVTAYIAYQQVQRLTQQNALIEVQGRLATEQNQLVLLQARLATIARQADLEQLSAARAYDEITGILDQNASSGAIMYALDRLPEAMVMPVTIVDPAWSPNHEADELNRDGMTPRTKTVYPNLVPLAQRLLTFAKSDRPANGIRWSNDEVGLVSTGIVHALHRLGFGNAEEIPTAWCVWDCIFDFEGTPRDDADEELNHLRDSRTGVHILAARVGREGQDGPDIRHARAEQLEGVRLPGAFLVGAQLQGAFLAGAQLRGTDLSLAHLQGAFLIGAQLQGAELFSAQLQGALLNGAQLQGAELVKAQLQGAFLGGAQLQGADLSMAQLQGADLDRAQLQGADLSMATLSAQKLRFVLDRSRNVALFDENQHEGWPVITIDIPAAMLPEVTFGAVVILDGRSRYGFGQVGSLTKLQLPDEVEAGTWWRTLDAAEADLRQRLGDRADGFISALEERRTTFTDALLDGVLIGQGTLDGFLDDWVTPPVNEAFAAANTDLAAIAERTSNPYRFPSWEELLALAKQQASERVNDEP